VKTLALRCERCGSASIRRARLQGFSEAVQTILGRYPFRCRGCQHRFSANVLLVSQLFYAKCPQCLSADLAVWSRKHYHPGLLENLLITFGAHQYRCAACRRNFVSFRPKLV
jgi:Zn finger protein HypA/HybF involved in hydrogenase expression